MAQKDRNKRGCRGEVFAVCGFHTQGYCTTSLQTAEKQAQTTELAETILSYEHTCKSRRRKCHCHSVHHHHMLHLSHGFVDAGTGLS